MSPADSVWSTSGVAEGRPRGRRWPLCVTTAPLFIQKVCVGVVPLPRYGGVLLLTEASLLTWLQARLLPHSYFVVGYDTAVRLINPKYYANDVDAMLAVFAEMRALGCGYVAGEGGGGCACRSPDDEWWWDVPLQLHCRWSRRHAKCTVPDVC